MTLKPKLPLLFLLMSALTTPAWSAPLDILPFQTSNRGPMTQIFGIPSSGTALLLAPGETAAEFGVDTVQNFSHNTSGDESIYFDGETYRFNLALRRGILPGIEAGIELPYLSHRGGFLDSFIEDFHDTFGMPQNGRNETKKDQLLYTYIRDGIHQVTVDENAEGVGDIRLNAAWQISRSKEGPQRGAALHASLKLPTGNSDDLLGSGSTDLALWLTGSRSGSWGDTGLALFGSAGVIGLTDGEVAEEYQRNLIGFAMVGGGWRPYSWMVLKLQVDGHTPFYDSDLKELGDLAALLTVGGDLALSEQTSLELAVSEDIVTETSPDVVFRLALRSHF